MEQDLLNPRDELKNIFGQLKQLLAANQDIGLETPALSKSTLEYFERSPSQITTLEELRNIIGDCRRCRLSNGRKKLVFGEGSSQARLLFVGEGPGKDEDIEGRPFVGEAGKLLTKIINAMGLKREDVFICNVVKCRPPKNRDPEKDEIATCIPFLKCQIELIRPEVICTLGRIALQALFGDDIKITHERGKWRNFMDIPLMPTYHPAYLLRNISAKRPVWDDIKLIMEKLGLEVKK